MNSIGVISFFFWCKAEYERILEDGGFMEHVVQLPTFLRYRYLLTSVVSFSVMDPDPYSATFWIRIPNTDLDPHY